MPVASRSVESSLNLGAAIGLLGGGWVCLLARAIDAWCAPVDDPRWRLRFAGKRMTRERRWWWDHARLALWDHVELGTWPADRLALSEWMAYGSLFGGTFAIMIAALS